MRPSSVVLRVVTGGYLILFFIYLLMPLVFMSLVAFNSSTVPQVSPWQGFTLKWFGVLLADNQMWGSLINSFIVAFFVVIISVPIGLSASLLLTRLQFKYRDGLYAVLVSPLLLPGIIIGISTFLFWDRAFQLSGGLFTTIMAQASFISGYSMLLIMARSQRFDRIQEDAAFDLGATHWQVFYKITLPFLSPALISAAALAFMQSFDNYNTTLFAIGFEQTLPIYIGSKLRSFISPAMNALSFIFILFTLTGAVIYETLRRRELRNNSR